MLAVLLALAAAAPRPSLDATLSQFAGLVEIRDLAVAADGRRVCWVQSVNDKTGALPGRSFLELIDLDAQGKPTGPPKRADSCAKGCAISAPAFSPDRASLAFLSDAQKKGQPQLYLRDLAKGQTRRLTQLDGALSAVRYSPDGKKIALLAIEGDASAAGPLGPAPANVGVMEEVIHESRIAVVDLASGKVALVSPPDLFVYEYDWSPDSNSFAYTGAHGSGDDNWWVAELFTQSAAGGAATSLLKPQMQLAVPRWSPDGKSIAFIGGLMSDEGLTGGDLYLISKAGGEARNLTPKRKSSPSWFQWASADSLLVAEWAAGESAIFTLRPSDGATTLLHHSLRHLGVERYSLSLAALAGGSRAAFVAQDFQKPAEVYFGALGDESSWQKLSHLNEKLSPWWGAAQSIHWAKDGFDEQGFLLAPSGVEPGKTYPMITLVHGGPAWASSPGFNELWGTIAAQGFYLFLPNPRGSFGQGEAFTAANVRDFGGGDLRDILAGVDAAVAAAPIDQERLGLFGWSYGGYMAMWAVTQTQRFQAAVAGAGIANWQSYYGENKIDQWMIPYFGASVYDDPGVYAKASPINFIKQVKTPTLVLQGELDAEVPAAQALEFWHALKTFEVPTQLVVYAGEGHLFRKPENQRDMYRRLLGWFAEHLKH